MPKCTVDDLVSILCESIEGDGEQIAALRRQIVGGTEFAAIDINSLDVVDFSMRVTELL